MEHDKRVGFTREVESAAHLRQNGICALCGTSLMWGHDHQLPVFPLTGGGHPGQSWRKEVDNCVIVCNSCWMWAKVDDPHAPTGAPHETDDYKYSHGKAGSGGHKEWAVRMMGRGV